MWTVKLYISNTGHGTWAEMSSDSVFPALKKKKKKAN